MACARCSWRRRSGNGHPAQVAISSEQGVTEHEHDDVIYTHQLGPGEMVALDRRTGRCYYDKEIKAELMALTAGLGAPAAPPRRGGRHGAAPGAGQLSRGRAQRPEVPAPAARRWGDPG